MTLTFPSATEVESHLTALLTAHLLDPMEMWMAGDPHFHQRQPDALAQVKTWTKRLLGPDSDDAVHAIVQLIAVFYPSDSAFEPALTWWESPLGRVTAHRFGHPGATAVSYATAGAMLGISRQGVHDLVKRNKLATHPDGGVATSAIQQRLSHSSVATLVQSRSHTEQLSKETNNGFDT